MSDLFEDDFGAVVSTPLQRPPRKSRRRIVGKALVFATLLLAGAGYEQVGARRDRRRLPPIGRAVDIGGRRLNIFCSGQGTPAVVLEAGAGHPGYSWAHIQPEIAKFTTACWYDRAGEGWSDPGPFPRTSAAIARDLHGLLHRAGVPSPYVLVGHSIGGLHARVYNGQFPEDVAGMVLVDAAHEDEPRRAPAFMLGPTLPRGLWPLLGFAARTARCVGFIRLTRPVPELPDDPAQRTREQIVAALQARPAAVATLMGDASAPESYSQAHSAAGLHSKPLIVLTRGKQVTTFSSPEDRAFAAYNEVWIHEIQPQLVRLSTAGRQIVVKESGHDIPEEAPQAVIEAVRELVAAINAG